MHSSRLGLCPRQICRNRNLRLLAYFLISWSHHGTYKYTTWHHLSFTTVYVCVSQLLMIFGNCPAYISGEWWPCLAFAWLLLCLADDRLVRLSVDHHTLSKKKTNKKMNTLEVNLSVPVMISWFVITKVRSCKIKITDWITFTTMLILQISLQQWNLTDGKLYVIVFKHSNIPHVMPIIQTTYHKIK